MSHYRDKRHWHPYQYYINEDLRWLRRCDALYRIPGESGGADIEVAEAERLGIPVFRDLTALATWLSEPTKRVA